MGFGRTAGFAENAAVSHGNAQGFRVFRAGKREENGGVGRQLGKEPDKVCMLGLVWMVLRHKWGGYSEIPFSGGRGRWQRVVRSIASCQRSSAKSALWRSWFLLLRGLMGGVFSSMRAPAFEVHADEVVAAELVRAWKRLEAKGTRCMCTHLTARWQTLECGLLDEALRV